MNTSIATPKPFSALMKIFGWNFLAAIIAALFFAAGSRNYSDGATGLGILLFIGFPVINIILLVITAFRKSGTKGAILAFLLAAIVMPVIGFAVCMSGLSGANFH